MSDNDLGKTSLASGQHDIIQVDSLAGTRGQGDRHPDARWFGEGALGLFIHWGLAAVDGQYDLSWGMMRPGTHLGRAEIEARYGSGSVGVPVCPADYWAVAKRFDPRHFEPVRMLRAAREAGFSYAVLTTRHHDGFALWPSASGGFDTGSHLGGRDLVGEYVAACRETGLRVGLYYSPPDWHFRQRFTAFGRDPRTGCSLDSRWQPAELATPTEVDNQAYNQHLVGQVRELLTRYGKIDLLWFDGAAPADCPLDPEGIRAWQPGVVINNRLGLGQGDYVTPEGAFPETRPDGWWELCHVLNVGGWGYRSHEIYKPAGFFPAEYAKVRAWNGNFLLNVAPDGDGRLPAAAYARLAEIKSWMQVCGEAYHGGATGGPWPEQSNRPVTCRDDRWYIHFDYLCDGHAEIRGLEQPPRSVVNLRTQAVVPYRFDAGVLSIDLDPSLLSLMGEIVVLEMS